MLELVPLPACHPSYKQCMSEWSVADGNVYVHRALQNAPFDAMPAAHASIAARSFFTGSSSTVSRDDLTATMRMASQ
jgi:hypothetical protein